MPTYLLTWNPKLWSNFEREQFAREIAITASGKPYEMRWSTGNRKNIEEGDRLFIVRLGVEPRGIFAAGWAVGRSVEDEHWDAKKAEKGRKMWYVNGRYDRILNTEFPGLDLPLSTASFTSEPLSRVRWAPRTGGIEIPKSIAELLEELWELHLAEVDRVRREITTDSDEDK